MATFFTKGGHFVVGLAVIGALAALIAVGAVTAAVGVPVITGVGSALIGGALGLAGTGSGSSIPQSPPPPAAGGGGGG